VTTQQLKQAILEQIDFPTFYRKRVKRFRHNGGKEATALCPFHDDHKPSLCINVGDRLKKGAYHCKGCGARGDVFKFVQETGEASSFAETVRVIAAELGIASTAGASASAPQSGAGGSKRASGPKPTKKDIEAWHKALLANPGKLEYLIKKRGWSREVIERRFIGLHPEGRYSVPLFDARGRLKGCKLYKPGGRPKMIHAIEGAKAQVYPAERVTGDLVVIVEGEPDAFCVESQTELPARTGTGGAGVWRKGWNKNYKGKQVVAAYDNDSAGENGALKVAEALQDVAATIRIIRWPEWMGEKEDVTDFLVKYGKTAEDFERLIDEAEWFKKLKRMAELEWVEEVEAPISVEDFRKAVEQHFPGRWRETRVCLATIGALTLADSANCVAVNLVGAPSSSKTTVLSFFDGLDGITYHSDSFTPAAFVSHAANRSADELAEVDLLPRIQGKVIIIPELAPVFSKRHDDLIENIATLTRVFDGQGYTADSGSHGQRGYQGDFLFGWLGATTPLPYSVWKVMGKLGSRMLFLHMLRSRRSNKTLVDDLCGRLSYRDKVKACREAARSCVAGIWQRTGGFRSVQWDRPGDTAEVVSIIVAIAELVAHARGLVSVWRSDEADDGGGYSVPIKEDSRRLQALLYNLARGHAVVWGRTSLAPDDLSAVLDVALSSMPDDRIKALMVLLREGSLRNKKVQDAVECCENTAKKIITAFDVLGVTEAPESAYGDHPVAPAFQWTQADEFQEMLDGAFTDENVRALAERLQNDGEAQNPDSGEVPF